MEFAPVSPGFALLKAVLTPVLPASGSLSGPSRFPLDVLDRVLDWCDTETLDAMGETCKTVRALRLHRPRVDIGPYRLLHSHSPPDGVFTALDAYGDTTSVLVGGLRFDDYGKEDGCGYNLRLSTGTETAGERTGAVAKLIGLSVSAVEKEASETVA
ncbi:hypothetical protein EXIGLDRAFT_732998 [Exidia glandulosa HHB12029]|uniref:Uncharacterized protein n=1 Tax=Exidia glandulosa HHB12029 TaxID=1314781 RepID=A0A165KMX9_EXIGL|nr:hypothetical protein EXIGLDRAFT_732998 [Exidia glandulosa HHB12029]